MEKVTAAAVQATPVFDKACRLIEGPARRAGVFPETFVPTYPDWVWRSTTRSATTPGPTCSGWWSTPASGRSPSRTRRLTGRRPTTPPWPTRGRTMEERTMPADQAELHRRAVEEFDARVRAVGDDQWELPTPCADWNVRQLVNHLVYENRWTVPLMEGSTIAEVGDRYEGDLLGDAPRRPGTSRPPRPSGRSRPTGRWAGPSTCPAGPPRPPSTCPSCSPTT